LTAAGINVALSQVESLGLEPAILRKLNGAKKRVKCKAESVVESINEM
jgi:hypothetical protein